MLNPTYVKICVIRANKILSRTRYRYNFARTYGLHELSRNKAENINTKASQNTILPKRIPLGSNYTQS